ncbi:hypothetical protein D3C84_738170 [compost metagenome]
MLLTTKHTKTDTKKRPLRNYTQGIKCKNAHQEKAHLIRRALVIAIVGSFAQEGISETHYFRILTVVSQERNADRKVAGDNASWNRHLRKAGDGSDVRGCVGVTRLTDVALIRHAMHHRSWAIDGCEEEAVHLLLRHDLDQLLAELRNLV